jgi:hypothetical protein
MRNQKDIDLIYKHTHKDAKGISQGKKCCMWLGKFGTTHGPIEVMPEETYQERLKSARSKA